VHAVGVADVDALDDVRVVEARDRAGLAEEALAELVVLGVLGRRAL
jgi:hypothetical protein